MRGRARAINAAMNGKPLAVAAPTARKEAPTTKTIREHSESFLQTYKPEAKPSTKRNRRLSIAHLLKHFGDTTLEELKQSDIGAYVANELKRGMSRKTINCHLAVLSSLIKFTTGEKAKLRLNAGGKPTKIHAVDPADVERLVKACTDDRYRAVILLAYEAGLRAGEIRGLQWTDIKDGQLTVRRALDKETGTSLRPKHDKERTVPLSPPITEALATLPRRALWDRVPAGWLRSELRRDESRGERDLQTLGRREAAQDVALFAALLRDRDGPPCSASGAS